MGSESYGRVTATTFAGGVSTEVSFPPRGEEAASTITADVFTAEGGSNKGPSPTKLLLGALASCKAMTARAYARHKGWPLEDIIVTVEHRQGPSENDPNGRPVHRLEATITLKGELTAEQRSKIVAITDRCHVQQLIQSGPEITHREVGVGEMA